MIQKYPRLSSLTLCFTLVSSNLYAAKPVSLQHTSFSELTQSFQLSPVHARKLAGEPANSLQVTTEHVDENHITHVRMQQQYAGFPVYGGYAIIHTPQPLVTMLKSSKGRHLSAVKMNGTVYQDIKSELGQPSPDFKERAAHALQQFQARYAGDQVSEAVVVPMVYIDKEHQAFWAYKVSVLVQHDDQVPERPTAILDAKTFMPHLEWNDLKTARSVVKGTGFGGNQHMGQYQFGKERPLLMISRDDEAAICYMENTEVKVVDLHHKYSGTNSSMHFSCGQPLSLAEKVYQTGYKQDGYDLENGAYSPSNDAMYVGQVIGSMYKGWYGVNALMDHGKPMQLVMRVHFGLRYENAFWDNNEMTFGDGDRSMYPLVSLGIGAHEISHGFTEQHAALEYIGQPGGMNESFSDMASQAAENFSDGSNSWKIGSEIMKKGSGFEALRYMDQPSRDGASIERADEYYDGLDVHYSSGVYNRLFYLLATQQGWNVRKAFHVMVKANMDYWTPYSTFSEGACGILSATQDLGFSTDDVKQALDGVAIAYQNCE